MVSAGGLTVLNQTMGNTSTFAYYDVPPLPYANPGDGIVGFCFQGDSVFMPQPLPWFYNLCAQKIIDVCRFGLAFGTFRLLPNSIPLTLPIQERPVLASSLLASTPRKSSMDLLSLFPTSAATCPTRLWAMSPWTTRLSCRTKPSLWMSVPITSSRLSPKHSSSSSFSTTRP